MMKFRQKMAEDIERAKE
jgi:hypothetical protein